jgi:hypothetical protein
MMISSIPCEIHSLRISIPCSQVLKLFHVLISKSNLLDCIVCLCVLFRSDTTTLIFKPSPPPLTFECTPELYSSCSLIVASVVPERMPCPTIGHFGITATSWNGRKQAMSCTEDHQGDADDGSKSNSRSTLSMGCSSGSSTLQIRMKSQCESPTEFFAGLD